MWKTKSFLVDIYQTLSCLKSMIYFFLFSLSLLQHNTAFPKWNSIAYYATGAQILDF